MQRINNTDEVPPGNKDGNGWFFIHPVSGAKIMAGGYDHLVKAVARHCKDNDYPPVSQAELQDAICRRMPPGAQYCSYYEPGSALEPKDAAPIPVKRRIFFEDATRFIGTLGNVVKDLVTEGRPAFDSVEEATRRADICRKCPKNIYIEGCTGCRGFVNYVVNVVGDRRTPYDSELQGCEVCGCVNRVSVHVNLQAQRAALSPEVLDELPSFCWKKP